MNSSFVGNLVLRQALVRMECHILGIEDGKPWATLVAKTLNKEEVMILRLQRRRAASVTRCTPMWLQHLREASPSKETQAGQVVHGIAGAQVSRRPKCTPKHRADHHAVLTSLPHFARLRDVTVGLRSRVSQVDAEAKHVTTIPVVPLCAMRTRVVAKRRAQTQASRDGACICSFAVGWWLQPVRVDNIENPIVRPMIELMHSRLLAVFLEEVLSV